MTPSTQEEELKPSSVISVSLQNHFRDMAARRCIPMHREPNQSEREASNAYVDGAEYGYERGASDERKAAQQEIERVNREAFREFSSKCVVPETIMIAIGNNETVPLATLVHAYKQSKQAEGVK